MIHGDFSFIELEDRLSVMAMGAMSVTAVSG